MKIIADTHHLLKANAIIVEKLDIMLKIVENPENIPAQNIIIIIEKDHIPKEDIDMITIIADILVHHHLVGIIQIGDIDTDNPIQEVDLLLLQDPVHMIQEEAVILQIFLKDQILLANLQAVKKVILTKGMKKNKITFLLLKIKIK